MLKRALIITFTVLCLLTISACSKNENRPPDPGTPAPAPLTGIYESEYGTLDFQSDGLTVLAALTDEFAELNGECKYYFRWYHFGDCRWDVATELLLVGEGANEFSFSILGSVQEDRFELSCYQSEPAIQNIVFIKQEGESNEQKIQ